MKANSLTLIILLMSAGVAAQVSPGESLGWSRRAQDAGHYKEAKAYAQAAVAAYLNSNQPDSSGEAYVMLWSSSGLDGLDYAGRIPILDKARQAFEQAGNRKRQADVLTDEAELYDLTNNSPAALQMALHALQLYQDVRYPQLQAVYSLLSRICTALADYSEGVRYGLLSIHTAESTGDTSLSLCAYYNHLAINYLNLKETLATQIYFQKSLTVALKFHDTASVVLLARNIICAYTYSKDFEKGRRFYTDMLRVYPFYFGQDSISVGMSIFEIYTGLRQFQRARAYVKMLEAVARRDVADYSDRWGAAIDLGKYYIKKGKYDSGRYYTDYGAELAKKHKSRDYLAQINYNYFCIDSLSGHYVNAIKTYERYKAYADSNLAVAKSKQLAQYSALYETQQKDRSIQELKQQAGVQANRLRQEASLRRMTIGGVAILLALLAVLYYAFRVKQESNWLLRSQRKEIDQKNKRLERLVEEKDWLVKESHHRVKNNLHTVISLLESQAGYLKSDALRAIEISQHRIYAMSLIHQKIYQSEDIKTIDMGAYLREFIDYLSDSFGRPDHILFVTEIESLHFAVAQAVPVALIVNEAVTNSIKYAFPVNRAGGIWVELHQVGQRIELLVADNGTGMTADKLGPTYDSFGLKLMRGLAGDLRGSIRFESRDSVPVFEGTRLLLAFDADPLNEVGEHAFSGTEQEMAL
jgi:two-component system, sensor histidine kinase PdtaS